MTAEHIPDPALQVETLTKQLAKVEALYETLARKHSILVNEHQDLIRRAFPTPIPIERVIDNTPPLKCTCCPSHLNYTRMHDEFCPLRKP